MPCPRSESGNSLHHMRGGGEGDDINANDELEYKTPSEFVVDCVHFLINEDVMADTNECNDTIHNNPFLTAHRVGCPTLVSRSTVRTSAPQRSTCCWLAHPLENSPPNAFNMSLHSGSSSEASNSIRISARTPSVSTGSQHNATTRRFMYNVNYHQRATASPLLPIHDSQTILDGIMQGQPNYPYSPIHVMRNIEPTATRSHECTCICLDKVYPKDCLDCRSHNHRACNLHTLIPCSHDNCPKLFHLSCICSLMRVDIQNTMAVNAYKCIECTEQVITNNNDTTFVDLNLKGKMRRLGMKPSTLSGSDKVRAQKKKLNAILRDMTQCLPQMR